GTGVPALARKFLRIEVVLAIGDAIKDEARRLGQSGGLFYGTIIRVDQFHTHAFDREIARHHAGDRVTALAAALNVYPAHLFACPHGDLHSRVPRRRGVVSRRLFPRFAVADVNTRASADMHDVSSGLKPVYAINATVVRPIPLRVRFYLAPFQIMRALGDNVSGDYRLAGLIGHATCYHSSLDQIERQILARAMYVGS